MHSYNKKRQDGYFSNICSKLALLVIFLLGVGGAIFALKKILTLRGFFPSIAELFGLWGWIILGGSAALAVFTVFFYIVYPLPPYIVWLVRRSLFSPQRGNPLKLKDGQLLPRISCRRKEAKLELRIYTEGFSIDEIRTLAPVISSSLTGKVKNYKVTRTEDNESSNFVTFIIEDVSINFQYEISSIEDICSICRTLTTAQLFVQKDSIIDLTTCGSILVAGKTRSGKTYGITSLLYQALVRGRDKYGSQVLIIDPKNAELSRLPHTVSVDLDGGGRAILAAIEEFAESRRARQSILNDLSEIDQKPVHWQHVPMAPSFLFIDEYVACRGLFPKKASKEEPNYSVEHFDTLIKEIVTMGASAGCFAIIATAEASVGEGGLPQMINSAMGTKVLFRPSMAEAKFLWSSDKLDSMVLRVFAPGDAWLTTTDGEHDNCPSFVRFPSFSEDFAVFSELRRLLIEYYEG